MSLSCRSCLVNGQKDYVSLLAIFPGFGNKSILDLLRIVTSLEIPYSETLPRELCMNCFEQAKIAYTFIVSFRNSQEILQKNTQKFLVEDQKCEDPVLVDSKVKKENVDYFADSDGSERIVIVNDDECEYEDIVQEIFGYEEPKEKEDNNQRGVKPTKHHACSNIDQEHSNLIMVSIDDVLRESLEQETFSKLKLPEKRLEYNISHQDQGKFSLDEVGDIEDTSYYSKEEDNTSSDVEEDETQFIEDNIKCQDIHREIFEMEDQDRNINNIQIINIEDVVTSSPKNKYPLSSETKKNDSNKRILTVEDVLNIKTRTKRIKTNDALEKEIKDFNPTKRKENENKIILSVEDVLKMKVKKKMADGGSESFSCDICLTTFDEYRKLRMHKNRIHNPNWQEIYKCPICGLQNQTKSAHSHHLAKHKNKRYPCDQCEKTYMSGSKMREHVLRVHEKKHDNKYICPDCGKGFKFSNALEYHMNKHTNSRNFVCRYCGFACLALSALKRHERVHTGERPYQCKYCNKTFAGAPEKQKHEFGHEGVFRYECKYCNKKFIQTYNMKVHWMQHKGPYACEVCKRAFADAEILKFHYAHAHKIKDVIIEEAQSETELITDKSVDTNIVL